MSAQDRFTAQTCKALGVTPAGLSCLAKAIANNGLAEGRGFGREQGARGRLTRDGLIAFDANNRWMITDAGRSIVMRARAMGW